MRISSAGKVNIGGVGNISPYGIRFAINGTGSGGAGLYFGSGVIIPTDNTPTIIDANVDLGASNYRFKDLYLSGVMAAGNGSAATPSVRGADTNTGLFFPSGGVTAITRNGVEAMRISSAGHLGISNSSPAYSLSICNPANPNRNGMEIAIGAGDSSSNTIQNYNRATGAYTPLNIVGNILTFGSGPSAQEALRIDASRQVLVGCTSVPSSSVKGLAIRPNGTAGQYIAFGVSLTQAVAVQQFINPNGVVGSIQLIGSATQYLTSSDYRLKENVVAMTGATERLKQLNPSRFNFIADADTTVDGFLAHEVQDVVPEAITGAKDAVDADGNPDYQGIDQSKLVPLLVATIQELEARLTELENN